MNRYSYGQGVGFDGDGGLQRPGEVQNHPGERDGAVIPNGQLIPAQRKACLDENRRA